MIPTSSKLFLPLCLILGIAVASISVDRVVSTQPLPTLSLPTLSASDKAATLDLNMVTPPRQDDERRGNFDPDGVA